MIVMFSCNIYFLLHFVARSSRNATNRAKLKMLHHIGSKPIREIIYQKGGQDGNPPDLTTIIFETPKATVALADFRLIQTVVFSGSHSFLVVENPSMASRC
ncbi:hypothetical protein MTR67_002541 [Solanum verrucosum]|uniref:Uncharacterized protein n=1 Tax=Solanum verrucosum TaxID=315347 RepID=A0AAF0T8I3_SOLVR|nr:hypothetical protein MTR67_002541 [Solanum verrucosum]